MGFFGCILYSWGSQGLTHTLLLFPVGESQTEMISLGTEQYHVGGEDNSDKIKLFLFLSLMCQNLYFFFFFTLHWSSGTSPLESFTSTKALLSVSDCLRQCSPKSPGLWLRGAGASSQDTAGSMASTEICILLPSTWMGKAFYGSCGILCSIPQLLQRYCGWMPNYC